jgi:hypothetical protein
MCIRVCWCMPLESNQLPSAYRAGAHPYELRMRMLVGTAGFEPAASRFRAEVSTRLTYIPKVVQVEGLESPVSCAQSRRHSR